MKNLRLIIAVMAIAGAIFLLYRITFIRTVNYEIAGMRIPSKYNMLTGSVRPIKDYKGKRALPVITPSTEKKIGLSDGQVAAARIRWSVFEQWVKGRKEYKGWDTDPVIFQKASEAFKKDSGSRAKAIAIQ